MRPPGLSISAWSHNAGVPPPQRKNLRVKPNLMKRGLTEEQAFRSAFNQRGPWWNSGASHMNQAFPKTFFDRLGLVSLLDTMRRLQCVQ